MLVDLLGLAVAVDEDGDHAVDPFGLDPAS